jgi:hypothetical protein
VPSTFLYCSVSATYGVRVSQNSILSFGCSILIWVPYNGWNVSSPYGWTPLTRMYVLHNYSINFWDSVSNRFMCAEILTIAFQDIQFIHRTWDHPVMNVCCALTSRFSFIGKRKRNVNRKLCSLQHKWRANTIFWQGGSFPYIGNFVWQLLKCPLSK